MGGSMSQTVGGSWSFAGLLAQFSSAFAPQSAPSLLKPPTTMVSSLGSPGARLGGLGTAFLPIWESSPWGGPETVRVPGSQRLLHVLSVDGDPHFIIQVPEKDDALCFNIDEDPGTVLRLIQDPVTGLTVNGQIIGDKRGSPDSKTTKTYFGKLGITNAQMDFRMEVTTEMITLWNGAVPSTFSWLDTVTVTQDGLSVMINRKKNMVISFGDGVTFVVVLHEVWKKLPVHHDFLGFYVVDSHRMSAQTHGLLGQFFHPLDFEVSDIHPGSDPTKPDATMLVKNHRLTVTRGSQKDYRKDASIGTKVICWFVHNNGEGLIDGIHTDYIVPNLF